MTYKVTFYDGTVKEYTDGEQVLLVYRQSYSCYIDGENIDDVFPIEVMADGTDVTSLFRVASRFTDRLFEDYIVTDPVVGEMACDFAQAITEGFGQYLDKVITEWDKYPFKF